MNCITKLIPPGGQRAEWSYPSINQSGAVDQPQGLCLRWGQSNSHQPRANPLEKGTDKRGQQPGHGDGWAPGLKRDLGRAPVVLSTTVTL